MAKRPNELTTEPNADAHLETRSPAREQTDVLSERHGFLNRIDREFRSEFVHYALSLCRDYDKACDLVQDAYRRFLESAWQSQAAKSNPIAAARSYIRRTIHSQFIDQRRANTRHTHIHNDMQLRQCAVALPHRDEVLAALDAVHGLPHDLCEVFVLHHVFGYRQNEIAEILDISATTVCRRLQKAAELLADTWQVQKS